MITLFSLEMGIAIIVEATLSFIGLSVPPDVTTWGQMLADARNDMQSAAWVMLVPVLASSSRCWAATCSATASASRSIPRLRLRATNEHARRSADLTLTARLGGQSVEVLRDVSPDAGTRQGARPGRRVRRRQEHDRPRHRRPHAAGLRGHAAAASSFDGTDLLALDRRRWRRAAGAAHRLHSAGAADRAQSGADHRPDLRRAPGAARRARAPSAAP